MIKAKFIVISGETTITKFMQAADMFDSGKIVAEVCEMEVSFKEGEEVTFQRCERLIPVIKEALESKQLVALIHLNSIIYSDRILFNKTILSYINKSVREVIDSKCNHTMFYKILERLNISFELTEHMYIV